ncbi:hypothetical protein CHS0354_017744 [Potamilus streckersoni]|uniref:Uncharacterized protein n=1 Tax=Potamilus streckersoni TaxID=2493646 RepID=A0AAE0S3M6_9BIVA|nr:hypothetical protein CHS0354_017744 [Potamilus streckersoni]
MDRRRRGDGPGELRSCIHGVSFSPRDHTDVSLVGWGFLFTQRPHGCQSCWLGFPFHPGTPRVSVLLAFDRLLACLGRMHNRNNQYKCKSAQIEVPTCRQGAFSNCLIRKCTLPPKEGIKLS